MISLGQTVAIAFTSGFLFGLYFVTVCFANRWLFFEDEGWRLRKRFHWLMVITTNSIAVLTLSFTIMGLRMQIIQMVFVGAGNKPSDWIEPPWNSILKCFLANTVALLADIVLMCRLWIIHAHKILVMLFPAFLWFGGIACTILQLFLQIAHVHNPNFGPYHWAAVNMNVGPGIALTPFWASTVALNAYCTGILIWRVWGTSQHGYNTPFTKQFQLLIRILTESGVLYLTVGLVHFCLWFTKYDFVIYLLVEANTFVAGIAFNLILVRTAQNRAVGKEMHDEHEKLATIRFKSGSRISIEVHSSAESDSAHTNPE